MNERSLWSLRDSRIAYASIVSLNESWVKCVSIVPRFQISYSAHNEIGTRNLQPPSTYATCQTPTHSVRFVNIRSVLPKCDYPHSLVGSCNANLVALTETWLKPGISNNEVFLADSNLSVCTWDRECWRRAHCCFAIMSALFATKHSY